MFTFTTVCHKTSDTHHPLVMLQTREGSKYLFGKVPEGAQRTLNENGMRLGKLRSVFMTGNLQYWSEIGGLPGLFLTTSDATSRGLDVFTNSSKVLSYIVATWRYFVFRKGIELNILEPPKGHLIGDSSVMILPVKIPSSIQSQPVNEDILAKFQSQLRKITSLMFPRDTSQVNSDDPDSYKSDPSETEVQTHVSLPDPTDNLGVVDQPSLSYIVRLLPVRGKFNPKRAVELGVKPGIAFRQLTQGERIQTQEGRWVEPAEVLEPPKEFLKTVFLDIPNQHYLHNTITSDAWFAKSEENGNEDVGLVYHFLGDDIDFRLQQYADFISKFPSHCKHVISHADYSDNSLVFTTSTIHHLKLKTYLNDNFCLPHIAYKELPEENLHKLKLLQSFTVSPSEIANDESNVINETWSTLYEKHVASLNDDPVSLNSLLKKAIIPLSPLQEASCLKDHVQVFTLGTGSALPAIHRNVLSNLVRVPYIDDTTGEIRFNSIILDGGENTLGTMLRIFGHNDGEQYRQIFKELKLIYLSHLHADHHLGLVSLINAWFAVNKETDTKLYLVLPWQFDHFLNEWFKFEGNFTQIDRSRLVYLSNEVFNARREAEFQQQDIESFEHMYDCGQLSTRIPRKNLGSLPHAEIQELYKALNLVNIETVRAIHCYWAYSVTMTFSVSSDETFRLSFSGDTRPNPAFYRSGMDTDLLIHEASLDDDLIEEALAKKHTTSTEAMRMAQLMRCPKVLLTHFSTRNSERHAFVQSEEQYEKQCQSLNEYLGSAVENIIAHDVDPDFGFNDMEICYAYDTMAVRYRDMGCQKAHYEDILALSPKDQPEERQLKEQMKMYDKRQQKREKRLLYKKMKMQNRDSS